MHGSQPELGIVFTDLMTDSPLYTAVTDSAKFGYRIINGQPAPHLFHSFKESYESFFNEKSSKYKNQLRKKEKIFRERFGSAFSMREYRRPEDVMEFLRAAELINKKTYQYKLFGETIDCGVESQKIYTALAHDGIFRSFVLWHEQIPLCFILGSQSRDGTFLHQKTGFDPEWRESAPGFNCNIQMLRRLYESDPPKLLDFGSGDADYKRLFATVSKLSASPVLIPRVPRYFMPFMLYAVSAQINEAATVVLDKFGL
ncbi:MAG: GNAT family N-acetyltransferase, partial [Bryocella sp.]